MRTVCTNVRHCAWQCKALSEKVGGHQITDGIPFVNGQSIILHLPVSCTHLPSFIFFYLGLQVYESKYHAYAYVCTRCVLVPSTRCFLVGGTEWLRLELILATYTELQCDYRRHPHWPSASECAIWDRFDVSNLWMLCFVCGLNCSLLQSQKKSLNATRYCFVR